MNTQTQQEKKIKTIADIGEGFVLIQDSQDVRATLETIGKLDELENVGCLFAEIQDGDYGRVYACERYVPVLAHLVYQLR